MRAVILAAGLGKRLKPVTDKVPKGLIRVGNKTLLERAIEIIKSYLNPDKIIFIVGHRGELIKQKFGGKENHIIIDNPYYDTKNNIYSLWLAYNHLNGDSYLLLNSDVLFHPGILKIAVESGFNDFLIIDNTKPLGEEEMKVVIEDGLIKKISKKLDPAISHGEYIGIAMFSSECAELLRQHLEKLLNDGQDQEFYEAAIDALIKEYPIHATYTKGLPWIEIDNHDDLKKAREIVEKWGL